MLAGDTSTGNNSRVIAFTRVMSSVDRKRVHRLWAWSGNSTSLLVILSGLACRLWIDVREARSSSDMVAILENIRSSSSWFWSGNRSDFGWGQGRFIAPGVSPLASLVDLILDLPRDLCSITQRELLPRPSLTSFNLWAWTRLVLADFRLLELGCWGLRQSVSRHTGNALTGLWLTMISVKWLSVRSQLPLL